MSRFFTRERFGRPQILAGLLLVVFLGQSVWLVSRKAQSDTLDSAETLRVHKGLELWGQKNEQADYSSAPGEGPEVDELQGVDPHHSNLWYLIAAAPALAKWPGTLHSPSESLWLDPIPYLLFGVLLGASLWYVARRLYGNAGGYIALTLYCFSPGIIRACAIWQAEPESGAAWGAFGTVFTAIAVAHTLYAPREVVVWNWRRILLLGLSVALAVGSQFSLIIVVPVALAFMLYLAPERRTAALIIWAAACCVGFVLLFAAYAFDPRSFWNAVQHARFFGITWKALAMAGAYRQVAAQLGQSSKALVLALPAALITYIAWPRTRYFGNTAPLLVALLFLFLALVTPHYPGLGFQLLAVPFLFLFVAGILADLLETRQRLVVMACVCGLLGAFALWSLIQLARLA